MPGIDGLRLQLGRGGHLALVPHREWSPEPPERATGLIMRFLQRYNLVQHGIDLSALLQREGVKRDQLEVIYSPFFDALFCLPEVPQLITCHDLTPLVAPNRRRHERTLMAVRHCEPLPS